MSLMVVLVGLGVVMVGMFVSVMKVLFDKISGD